MLMFRDLPKRRSLVKSFASPHLAKSSSMNFVFIFTSWLGLKTSGSPHYGLHRMVSYFSILTFAPAMWIR